MAELFQGLRWLHIAAGAVALVLFWIPLIVRKGGTLHIRIGWAYVACMSCVVVTAFAMSGMVFAKPLGVRHIHAPISPAQLATLLRNQRLSSAFFADMS